MTGLGFWGNGGSSSSSSNLSALAPPFTVDRFNPNPSPITSLNSNPHGQLGGAPYASNFGSSSRGWAYLVSSNSAKDYPLDSGKRASVTLVPEYSSSETINPASTNRSPLSSGILTGSESINSPVTHWSPTVHCSKAASDSLSYLSEARQYYSPYVSQTHDNDIPSVAFNETDYDLLSTSVPGALDEPSQDGYTESFPCLDYRDWENAWKGLAGTGQAKEAESQRNFFFKEGLLCSSTIYENYVKQEGCSHGGLSKGKENSSLPSPGNDADVIGTVNLVGDSVPTMSHTGSVKTKNLERISTESSKTPSSGASRNYLDFCAPTPSSTHEKEQLKQRYNFCENPSKWNDFMPVKKLSPGHVIRVRHTKTPASIPGSASFKNIGATLISTANGMDGGFSHRLSNEKEPCEQLRSEARLDCFLEGEPAIPVGKNDHHNVIASSSTMPAKNALDVAFETKHGFQVLDANAFSISNAEDVNKFVENSSENLEHHIPGEDSPCWRGASSHFSSFEPSEAVKPQNLMKKSQISTNLYEEAHMECRNNEFQKPLKELHEKTFRTENLCGNAANETPKNSSSLKVQISLDFDKPRNGDESLNNSNGNTNSLGSEQSCLKQDSSLLSSRKDATENAQVSQGWDFAAKPNLQILVGAMHNLSELLLLHCSSDSYSLNHQELEGLQCVISNLEACLFRKSVHVSPNQESVEGTIDKLEKEACPVKCGVRFEEAAFSLNEVDFKHINEVEVSHGITGKKAENCQGLLSVRNDANLPKDRNMVQAIKKALDENLPCEEELQPQPLLYKNLWLEAEAELCSIICRARFERLKEVGKSRALQEKDVPLIASAMKKASSSNIFNDPKETHKVTPEAHYVAIHKDSPETRDSERNALAPEAFGSQTHKESLEAHDGATYNESLEAHYAATDKQTPEVHVNPGPNTSPEDSSLSIPSSCPKDDRSSVMARFHILKQREATHPVNVKELEREEEVNGGCSGEGSTRPYLNLQIGTEDPVWQSHGSNRLQNQFNSDGYYSSFSFSDWEHVARNDFVWRG